ncbi:MAG TPA: energy transducer TonB [Candidatus Polarisedimenticolia bacterium]|jgi:TonB family protein|nr:energy transducer TonB [Candidatus Polarisedimenticolia bacterium]
MRGRFLPWIAGAALSALLVPGRLSAEPPADAADPLEGIDTEYQKAARLTTYFPWSDRWPPPAIDICPIATRHDSGTKRLLLRVAMRDVSDWNMGILEMAIDGSPTTLDLSEAGKPRLDLGGCHSTAEVDLPGHEEVLRRIASASDVEAGYGEGRRRKVYRFAPEDFDRFRRVLALYSLETLPPARLDIDQAPGPAGPGSSAKDISPPEIIPESRVPIKFPPKVMAKKPKGALIVRARVFRDGSVGKIRVVRPAGGACGLEEEALAAISQWKYLPGKEKGQPVDVDLTIAIDFFGPSTQPEDNFMRGIESRGSRPRKPPHP